MSAEESQCDYYEYCEPKLTPANDTVMRSPVDNTYDNCCWVEEGTTKGLIAGITFGGISILLLIVGMVYCFFFRRIN